jgi:hypothetical protein
MIILSTFFRKHNYKQQHKINPKILMLSTKMALKSTFQFLTAYLIRLNWQIKIGFEKRLYESDPSSVILVDVPIPLEYRIEK